VCVREEKRERMNYKNKYSSKPFFPFPVQVFFEIDSFFGISKLNLLPLD